MAKRPRWYQSKSKRKGIKAIKKKDCHPIIAIPTGAGKSLILCLLTGEYLNENIVKDVLILSHRSTILEQDLAALEEHFPDFEMGLYSSGLKSKVKKKITVAGIQSVWRKPEEFENVGLVLIDEAHLVNTKDAGMYREFLGYLDANYIGLTATPFRLGHGYIYKGKGALFNELAYDLTSTENYNKLVNQGYLAKMFSHKTNLKLEIDGIGKVAGDYAKGQLAKKFDREAITEIACTEIKATMEKFNLKRGLIFAIDTKHADNISKYMNEIGISCVAIHSKLKDNKEKEKDFKAGKYKMAVGIEMLTTGLDIPEIDMIGLLRPTASPSLHVQMLGRGGRALYAKGFDISKMKERKAAIKAGGKKFCMVMDFAGNIARLGPINDVHVEGKENKREGGNGEAIMKTCPKCNMEHYGAVRKCNFCGHEFEFQTRLTLESTELEVIATRKRIEEKVTVNGIWLDVDSIEYNIHSRPNKVSSMRVIYRCGFRRFNEFICIDHGYFPRHQAKNWIRARFPENRKHPQNLRILYAQRDLLKIPKKIFVSKTDKWNEITNFRF